MHSYDHKTIEKKWQQHWEKTDIYTTPPSVKGKENYYALVEFPYPSGNLHIGHWYAFAVPDIFARYKRMRGYNVLFPIGFDAFGLPAENAAIKRGLDPREWTYDNIAHMRGQLKSMGNMFDWSREIITADPSYYRWTQWLFLKMYESGLVVKKEALVNWDPIDKTVLANEQVLPDGTAERSGAVVEKKRMDQWFFKITEYADRLLADLEDLNWPKEIKESQRNWIGKSEGAKITFPLAHRSESIEVFTTRPDTLFGATYIVLAPEHPLVQELADAYSNKHEVDNYSVNAGKKSDIERISEGKEKTGVELKDIKAVNPATHEEIPVFIADYVLAQYGTGAIMAVPAHDERDFAFAQKFDLPIREVVQAEGVSDGCYTGPGVLVHSGHFSGLDTETAKKKITEAVGGEVTATYKLRDWFLSRQRYWGCPIPVVYDPSGNPHPVPEEHLPWELPGDVDFTPTGEAPLASSNELLERTEKLFGKGWKPEVDTMDTFVDSSWYFVRYLDPHNTEMFADTDMQKEWMPVDRYSGGAEHTTMHVLYSRFFHKALYDLGLTTEAEPYRERINRGLVLGPDGQKMSKRWGNVVDPDEQVERVGADTVKMYLAFIGPYNETGSYPWDLGGVAGVRRFLEKVWRIAEYVGGEDEGSLERPLHEAIQKVGDDIDQFKFNTAISALMIFANAIEKEKRIGKKQYETYLRLVAPFAPHLAEELWERGGHTTSIHLETWPVFDPQKIVRDMIALPVQINGKVRATITIAPDAEEAEARETALGEQKITQWLDGKKVTHFIYRKGKIANFVIADE